MPQADRVQERPRESSQGSSERACSSSTSDEMGEQSKVPFSVKRHGEKRGAARDWVDQSTEGVDRYTSLVIFLMQFTPLG